MKTILAAARPFLGLLVIGVLAGCTGNTKKTPPPSFDSVMSQAETQVGNGSTDAAIRGFEDAARVDPTRKEPWVRIAQLQFDQKNYARAIVAAEEAIQRDPDDLVADGVITVAGFRIADQSLLRLQGRGALASDTARKEAETLAATLRETMGDDVLAPPKPERTTRRHTRRSSSRASSSSSTEQASKPKASSSSSGSSDPFQNLGGN